MQYNRYTVALSTTLLSSFFFFSGCNLTDQDTSILTEKTKAYSQDFAKSFEGTGKVVVEEFSDVECPACRRFAPTYEQLKKAFKTNKNVEFRYNHFPLEQIHKYAYAGSLAVECARLVGGETAREEFLQLAFTEKKLSIDFYRNARKNPTLHFSPKQQEEFLKCFNEKKTDPIIKNHKQEGVKRNLRGTPTLYINGEEYKGSRDYDTLFLEINSKLQ